RTMSHGPVYFAGDAAHIHSPIGARGMNLGIEDAWVFAQLCHRGQLSRYAELRYAIDRRVVRQVCLFSRVVACEPAILRGLRGFVPMLLRSGFPRARMLALLTGTDHPLQFTADTECAVKGVPDAGLPSRVSPADEPRPYGSGAWEAGNRFLTGAARARRDDA